MVKNDTNIVGGIPALRGFRKQFLHTLRRIIESESNVIYPETIEDFAVYNNSGSLIEIVQVKDHSAPLTFSDLKTFFKNAIQVLKKYPEVDIKLASYGKLGSELNEAIGADELSLKKNKKFDTPEILNVFSRLVYIQLKEENEINNIKDFLNQYPMVVGEWQTAFDILMQDLYTGAEKEKAYTCQTLKEKLQNIGQYLVGRRAHHKEWGSTIIPLVKQKIEKIEKLSDSFYEGVSVTWSHVSAHLDIIRDQHLKTIEIGFKKSNIVIIHGASGQGKSTLAYRYLYDE
jgi:ABC-type multidrug transport system fused ATPase/permease subunit